MSGAWCMLKIVRPRRRWAAMVLAGSVACGCSALLDAGALSRGDEDGGEAGGGDASVSGTDTDTTGADAESGDAESRDAPSLVDGDATVNACPAFALFCDDFESGTLGKWSVQHVTNNGDLRVAGAFDAGVTPWRGQDALRTWAGPNPTVDGSTKASTANVEENVPAMLTGTFVFRFYIHIPAVLANDTSLAKLGHRSPAMYPEDINLKVASVNGTNRWRINTDNTLAMDSVLDSTSNVPIGRWTCVEWVITLGTTGHYTLYADGQTVLDATENTVGATATGYDAARIGFSFSPGTLVQQLFFDDVAFATQRVGCE